MESYSRLLLTMRERERSYSIPCLSASDGVGERKVVAPIAAGEKVSHT